MEYHWTLHTLILGSLAWSFSILALAWLFDLLKRFADRGHRHPAQTVPPRPPAHPAAAPEVRLGLTASRSSWRPTLPASSPGAETPEELVAAGASGD